MRWSHVTILTLQNYQTLPWENQLIRVLLTGVVLQTGRDFKGSEYLNMKVKCFNINYFSNYIFLLNRAVDGKLHDNYSSGSCTHTKDDPKTPNPWLVIDLKDIIDITHVKIKNRRDCCRKYISLNDRCLQNWLCF